MNKDPDEILPFCMRCHHIGYIAEDENLKNFCHVCGSGGTCVPMKRGDIEYLQENIKHLVSSIMRRNRMFFADEFKKWDTTVNIDGKWVLARPIKVGLYLRIKHAYQVLIGNADAVRFIGQ